MRLNFLSSLFSMPRILEYGHTLFSSYMQKVIEINPTLPNYRGAITGIVNSFPRNYSVVGITDIYKFKKRWEKVIASTEIVECKCSHREDVYIVFIEEENIQKRDNVIRCDDIKCSASVPLLSFETSEEYSIESAEPLQKHANKENFFTFIKTYYKMIITRIVIFKVYLQERYHRTPKLSTGENEPIEKIVSIHGGIDDESSPKILKGVGENLLQFPNKRSLKEHKKTKAIRFNDLIKVAEAPDYDRRVEKPWMKLRNKDLFLIYRDLNHFKLREMEVHEKSRHLTKFHN